jgi:DNA-directed RNA polymerase specialized sigma24 family protein
VGKQKGMKLDEISVRLLALIAIKDLPQKQQIALLSRVGFSPSGIAELIGMSSNAVRVALFSIRKSEKQGKKMRLVGKESENE